MGSELDHVRQSLVLVREIFSIINAAEAPPPSQEIEMATDPKRIAEEREAKRVTAQTPGKRIYMALQDLSDTMEALRRDLVQSIEQFPER